MCRFREGVDEGYRGTNQRQRASKVRLDCALALQIEARHRLPEKVVLSDELHEGILKLRLALIRVRCFYHFLTLQI